MGNTTLHPRLVIFLPRLGNPPCLGTAPQHLFMACLFWVVYAGTERALVNGGNGP